MVTKLDVEKAISKRCKEDKFSGVAMVKQGSEDFITSGHGFANRADSLEITPHTRFGIASGCKLFTAIAIGQLVEKGLISFNTRLSECLDTEFPFFDKEMTIHHLLTHTSGIPDYFDEAVMDDFEDLWKERPMYHVKSAEDFLPMFQEGKMMFKPGENFHYNNAGFIVLGLIIEKYSGRRFTDYIEQHVFQPCGMHDSGYFSLDNLPANTANGYIENEDGTWRTNIYSIPIKGGADGGAYITAPDMLKLWEGLVNFKLLDETHTKKLLTPHVSVDEEMYYGYGIWIKKRQNSIQKYFVMGNDPGVSFHSAFYPHHDIKLVIPSNKSTGVYPIMKAIEDMFSIK